MRFYNGLSEKFSEEFKNKTDKKELFNMQFEQADPYYKLPEEIENKLNIIDKD